MGDRSDRTSAAESTAAREVPNTPLVFVEDVSAPILDDADRHHLARVLRVRAGDSLTVSDGRGNWRSCLFGDEIEPLTDVVTALLRTPALTIAFALVKGQRPELVVQKLTELGVDNIVPFIAERSVVHWDTERAGRQRDRFCRVAREAAMQSRRVHLPDVSHLSTFEEVVQLSGAVGADREGTVLSLDHPTVLIGPEGGWSTEERFRLCGTVRLADHVLRAETAAIAAATVLQALRAGLVSGSERQ